jgi:hypothetical protein
MGQSLATQATWTVQPDDAPRADVRSLRLALPALGGSWQVEFTPLPSFYLSQRVGDAWLIALLGVLFPLLVTGILLSLVVSVPIVQERIITKTVEVPVPTPAPVPPPAPVMPRPEHNNEGQLAELARFNDELRQRLATFELSHATLQAHLNDAQRDGHTWQTRYEALTPRHDDAIARLRQLETLQSEAQHELQQLKPRCEHAELEVTTRRQRIAELEAELHAAREREAMLSREHLAALAILQNEIDELRRRPAPGELTPPAMLQLQATPKRQFLVVNAQVAVGQVVLAMLRRMGHDGEIVATLDAARAKLRHEKFAALLVDVDHDAGNGWHAAEQFQQVPGTPPVFFLGNWGNSGVIPFHLSTADQQRILHKPVTMARLRQMLEQITPPPRLSQMA